MMLPPDIAVLELNTRSTPDDEAAAVLTTGEAHRRSEFRSVGRQRSFALGRLAARRLLAERLGGDPIDAPLFLRSDGSLEAPGLSVSISHSGPYAAAAIGPCALGLDLEQIRPRSESLFRFVLSPEEYGLRDTVDLPQDAQIVLFWALKEAVLKAQRTGLRMSPKKLRLDIDTAAGSARVHGPQSWEAAFDFRSDHLLAVAWHR
jgi:4'-phosphopantetheinyl transferase